MEIITIKINKMEAVIQLYKRFNVLFALTFFLSFAVFTLQYILRWTCFAFKVCVVFLPFVKSFPLASTSFRIFFSSLRFSPLSLPFNFNCYKRNKELNSAFISSLMCILCLSFSIPNDSDLFPLNKAQHLLTTIVFPLHFLSPWQSNVVKTETAPDKVLFSMQAQFQ